LKSEYEVRSSNSKFQVWFSVDRFTQSEKFDNLLDLNQTLLPKENLILMNCSTSVKIYENYRGKQIFVSRVQTELINLVYRQEIFPGFSLTFIPL
jgi:hypothetical protein